MKHRWAVRRDGEVMDTFTSRAQARDYARWLRGHPCTRNLRRNNAGKVEVLDSDSEQAQAAYEDREWSSWGDSEW